MIKSEIFQIDNMMCRRCEKTLEHAVGQQSGVRSVEADYVTGKLEVEFDSQLCKKEQIERIIEQSGYSVKKRESKEVLIRQAAVILAALLVVRALNIFGVTDVFSSFPEIEEGVGFAALFVIGVLLMALNMLNLVPAFRKIHFCCPKFVQRITVGQKSQSSYCIGFLNGFMPCGPLQSMQLLAVASASIWKGALSMFFFCVGTIPLMLFFGVGAASLKTRWREKIMLVGIAMIFVFSVQMFQNNAAILGMGTSVEKSEGTYAIVNDEVQRVETVLQPGGYEEITVRQGIPVEWTIIVEEKNLNGCNNEILIPAYGIDIKLQPGDNIIQFTPEKAGTVPYSCWMGMIRSSINIIK